MACRRSRVRVSLAPVTNEVAIAAAVAAQEPKILPGERIKEDVSPAAAFPPAGERFERVAGFSRQRGIALGTNRIRLHRDPLPAVYAKVRHARPSGFVGLETHRDFDRTVGLALIRGHRVRRPSAHGARPIARLTPRREGVPSLAPPTQLHVRDRPPIHRHRRLGTPPAPRRKRHRRRRQRQHQAQRRVARKRPPLDDPHRGTTRRRGTVRVRFQRGCYGDGMEPVHQKSWSFAKE